LALSEEFSATGGSAREKKKHLIKEKSLLKRKLQNPPGEKQRTRTNLQQGGKRRQASRGEKCQKVSKEEFCESERSSKMRKECCSSGKTRSLNLSPMLKKPASGRCLLEGY